MAELVWGDLGFNEPCGHQWLMLGEPHAVRRLLSWEADKRVRGYAHFNPQRLLKIALHVSPQGSIVTLLHILQCFMRDKNTLSLKVAHYTLLQLCVSVSRSQVSFSSTTGSPKMVGTLNRFQSHCILHGIHRLIHFLKILSWMATPWGFSGLMWSLNVAATNLWSSAKKWAL